jgi:transketolase
MSYEALLKEYALRNEEVVVMTAENRALVRNLPPVLGPRFIDTGITEQTMIGAAAGLALRGRKPIVHALAAFLTMRAFEFVRTDVGISGLPIKMSSFVPGFLSDGNGPTHQAVEDISLMRGIPGMQVYCPADEEDLLAMLPQIWDNDSPAYVRICTRPAAIAHQPYEAGKAEIISLGKDVNILVYGMLLEQALQAKLLLESQGLDVGIVNIRSVWPIDKDAIMQCVDSGSLLVTLEDHFLTGGLYSILAEVLLKAGKTARVLPVALKSKWFKPALLQDLMEYEGFTAPQISNHILQTLGSEKRVAAPAGVSPNVFDE